MSQQDPTPEIPPRPSRRSLLRGAAGAAFGLTALGRSARSDEPGSAAEGPAVRNGRIKQSIVHWCFGDYWDVPKTIQIAKQLGCQSVELIDPKFFPMLKDNGLVCAMGQIDMMPLQPFVKGFNNPEHRELVIRATRNTIDACAEYGFRKVICFTGFRQGIPDDVGARNCVEGFKQILGHAEKKGVTLCLEMLNSRVTDHPMKGHPGYQGDHVDYCIEQIIKPVGSDHLKLLFDIYHVQVMDGDLIRRLRQYKEYIGHVHTAGNPGRGELDETQEIQYRPIMQALIDLGYDGYVGQEFIPTRDPLAGLQQAVTVCDV